MPTTESRLTALESQANARTGYVVVYESVEGDLTRDSEPITEAQVAELELTTNVIRIVYTNDWKGTGGN